jgi:hypothetical protein
MMGVPHQGIPSQGRRRNTTKSDSLDPSTLKKTSVRRVLFNVGGITLFSSIFRVTFFGRSISRRVSVWLWTFVASVAGRNGRHMTGHVWLHRNVRKLNCSRNLASPVKTISDFALHIAGTILMLAVWWRLGG